MPLELELLEDVETHIESFPSLAVFYSRDEKNFSILAGKVAWKGVFDDDIAADTEEAWLVEHGGKKVKGWTDLEAIFDG